VQARVRVKTLRAAKKAKTKAFQEAREYLGIACNLIQFMIILEGEEKTRVA
jgi:hypothetical protein